MFAYDCERTCVPVITDHETGKGLLLALTASLFRRHALSAA
jgi:hypothetical protein